MGSIDEEIFEITDFTCVTDWERFVGDLESRIRDWQLNDEIPKISSQAPSLHPITLRCLTDAMKYGDRPEFKISYFYPERSTQTSREVPEKSSKLVEEAAVGESAKLSHVPLSVCGLLQPNFDFVHESVEVGHHIVRYYGLRQFIVLEPSSFASTSNILSDDSFINLLLSAVLVASLNAGSDVPMFLQVADQWRWLYNGICHNRDSRTYFEMAHLRSPPSKCCHLSGILDVFKEQLGCAFTSPPPVKVSLRITYELRESFESNWPSQVDEIVDSPESLIGVKDFGRLPFGAIHDTVDKFYLSVTWLNMNEDMLVENEVYSDLDPLTAPHWNATVEFLQNSVVLLSESVATFLNLAQCFETVDQVLGPSKTELSAASALGRLTDSSYLELSALQSAMRKHALSPLSPSSPKDDQNPLDDVALTRLLQFLFPDAGLEESSTKARSTGGTIKNAGNGDKVVSPFPGSVVSVSDARTVDDSGPLQGKPNAVDKTGIEALLKKSKSAPNGSLTIRIALALCHLAGSMQGKSAVCHMWREFVLELRYRWDNGIALPGFDATNPSLADCLLHQKLQMLHCCILHKIKRQKQLQVTVVDNKGSASSESSKGDEFFDCYEDTAEIDQATVSKPEGRLRPLAADAFMVENASEHIYIPITQDPAPVTEDVLEEYGRMLTSMGTSDESAFARAKMQTPSLLSDMEAFKAANPNARMEDFIRWYSPRDWIEELDRETGRMAGRLSERMATPGNLWSEVWESARPIPVARQKRLFDDTTEAEKVLHWLYEMEVAEIVQHLAAPLCFRALSELLEESNAVNKFLDDNWKVLANKFVTATTKTSISDYEELCPQMAEIERMTARYRSLLGRLSSNFTPSVEGELESTANLEMEHFAQDLLTAKDVKILGASRGLLGRLLATMFSKDDRLKFQPKSATSIRFPAHYSKEYILRWLVPRPQASSRDCPQRCYVRIKANEFRAASAFTEDALFFLPERS